MSKVQVRLVHSDGEVKNYEYASVDLAIVALGRVVAGAGNGKAVPPAPKASDDLTPRQARADKGKKRGPYKKDANASPEQAIAASPEVDTAGAGKQAEPSNAGQPAASTSTPPAPASAPQPAPAAVPSVEQVQSALEKFYIAQGAKGRENTLLLLSRFGVTRGKDILPESRAEFIAKVDQVLAGAAI
jgi:hypothetical protein